MSPNDNEKQYRKRGVDYQAPTLMQTLPRRYYHDDAIYQEEVEKIFCRRWLLACREEELPGPGDFVLVPVGDESIIVVRTNDGGVSAHFNVCRHRGTRICVDESGCFEAGTITCPYHAWKYDLEGTLKAAPLSGEIPDFQKAKADLGLIPAHVARWGGFVFINLEEEPRPFESEMSALIGKFEDWKLPELRIACKLDYHLDCNWKIILQNYQECYHCPGVHPLLSKWTPFRSAVHDCVEGAVIGGYMTLERERGSMTIDGEAAGPPVCNVSGDDLQRVHYYSVFPNMLLSPHPDFVLYHRIRPLSVGSSRNDCFFLLHPDVIDNKRTMKRFESAVEFWDQTNRQDWQVCEQMQLGLGSRRFGTGRYTPQEDIPYALDEEVLKALGHDRRE